ncbi:hypothetical protein FOZ60_007114 [Perkinsus olseni]|uniref:Uncharacterized protein n=1 Tax=Perkinsus olseni TaxID=32597 RepID=A0A7J6NM17_PEROL|nr:hypothetical protein FOZ60_007114 [Perkinsus olseni]
MWSTLLSASSLLVGSLALNSPGTPHYYEFQVEIKSYCLQGLKDPHGNAPSCSTATAVATQGLTLPGMDDGTLTTRAHVIAGSDGSETMVEAHPSYPYQYFMRTSISSSTSGRLPLLNGSSMARRSSSAKLPQGQILPRSPHSTR